MQYTEQDLRRMREQAIQGAFEMQRRARLPTAPSLAGQKKVWQQETTQKPIHSEVVKQVPQRREPLRREAPKYYRTIPAVEMIRNVAPLPVRPIKQQARPAREQGNTCPLGSCPVGKLFQAAAGPWDRERILLFLMVILLLQEGSDQIMVFALIYIMF